MSVPANIAEGYSRRSAREYIQARTIARGSLAEVEYYIHFMKRTRLIETARAAALESARSETAALLTALIKALKHKHDPDATFIREETPDYTAISLEHP